MKAPGGFGPVYYKFSIASGVYGSVFSFASAFYFSKVVKKKKGMSLFVTICVHSGDGDDGVTPPPK